jgi:hypothetical protein
MKKVIIAALLVVALAGSAFAADVKVNPRISEKFKTDYADASSISWSITNNYAKASFVLEGVQMEAFYNLDGTEIATSKTIAFDKLPKAAIKYITQKYQFPPYKLKECIELNSEEKGTQYYVSLFEEGKVKLILEISSSGNVEVFKKEKIK